MTHRVHPYSHRLGIIRDWQSRWFARGRQYAGFLATDIRIREYLAKALRQFHVSSTELERRGGELKITIETSRPGLIIGKSGEGAQRLKRDIEALARREGLAGAETVRLDIQEVRSPESHAAIVAAMAREGIEKRMPFRRVLKQTAEKAMANRDVQGVRIRLSGRLGGADMARTEELKKGRVPLQTFRADIDYVHDEAHIPQGQIGIRVWIYRGEIFEHKKSQN